MKHTTERELWDLVTAAEQYIPVVGNRISKMGGAKRDDVARILREFIAFAQSIEDTAQDPK